MSKYGRLLHWKKDINALESMREEEEEGMHSREGCDGEWGEGKGEWKWEKGSKEKKKQ